MLPLTPLRRGPKAHATGYGSSLVRNFGYQSQILLRGCISLDEFVEPRLDLPMPLFQIEEFTAESAGFLKIERRFQCW